MAAPDASLRDFYQLPPEIRNLIYAFVLTTTSMIEISRCRVRPAVPVNLSSRTVYTAKSKVETWHGKRKRKPAAARVLGINLLRTCKAVKDEATSILYGSNHFSFEDRRAIQVFMFMIGERAALLANVVFHARHGPPVGLFNRLAKPRSVTIHFDSTPHTAVWLSVKPIFQTRRIYDPDWEDLMIELPLELQLRCFEAVKFVVPSEIEFRVDGQMVKIHDEDERGRRYEADIGRLLVEEGEEARAAKEMAEGKIAKMLGDSRTMRELEG